MSVLVERRPAVPTDEPIIRIVVGDGNDFQLAFVKRTFEWHIDWTTECSLQTNNPDCGGKTSISKDDMRRIGEALIAVSEQSE